MRGLEKGRFSGMDSGKYVFPEDFFAGMDDFGSEVETCYPGSRTDRIKSGSHRAVRRRSRKDEWA
jgi:hypothetical protein